MISKGDDADTCAHVNAISTEVGGQDLYQAATEEPVAMVLSNRARLGEQLEQHVATGQGRQSTLDFLVQKPPWGLFLSSCFLFLVF